MGTKATPNKTVFSVNPDKDWTSSLIAKALNPVAPNSAREAINYIFKARKHAAKNDFIHSFDYYKTAINLLYMSDCEQQGEWSKILEEANKEYGKITRHLSN